MPSALPTANLKSLECFRTIINTGSATAAARHLGVTQPGVSRLLAVLEEQIGFPLFERYKGRLLPTQEALLFFENVDIALNNIDRVFELARNLHDADFGELKIAAPPRFAEYFLPQMIAEFLIDHPRVQISLDSHNAEAVKELVAVRAVDCGFARMPVDHPALQAHPLIEARTVCVMPKQHKLASRKKVRAADLDGLPLIMLAKGKPSRLQTDAVFREAGVRMNIRVEAHTVGSACALVAEGTGVAIVSEMLAVRYADTDLVLLPLDPELRHQYAFLHYSNVSMSRVARKFLEHSQRFFKAREKSLAR